MFFFKFTGQPFDANGKFFLTIDEFFIFGSDTSILGSSSLGGDNMTVSKFDGVFREASVPSVHEEKKASMKEKKQQTNEIARRCRTSL